MTAEHATPRLVLGHAAVLDEPRDHLARVTRAPAGDPRDALARARVACGRFVHLAIVALLSGCTWAWLPPAEADDHDHEAWAAVRAEAEATYGDVGRCAEPDIWRTSTLEETDAACGYSAGSQRWGCQRGPSDRRPYVVVCSCHQAPRRLTVWEMTHAVRNCVDAPELGWDAQGYADLAAFRLFVDRVMTRLAGEGR